MSVHRILTCDEPGCRNTFNGSEREERAAGWVRVSKAKRLHRCPDCRALHPPGRNGKAGKGLAQRAALRKTEKTEPPKYGKGRAYVVGASGIRGGAQPESGISEEQVRKMLARVKSVPQPPTKDATRWARDPTC